MFYYYFFFRCTQLQVQRKKQHQVVPVLLAARASTTTAEQKTPTPPRVLAVRLPSSASILSLPLAATSSTSSPSHHESGLDVRALQIGCRELWKASVDARTRHQEQPSPSPQTSSSSSTVLSPCTQLFVRCLTQALRQNMAQLTAVAPRLHTKEQVRAVFVVVVLLVTLCGGPVKVSVGGRCCWSLLVVVVGRCVHMWICG